MTTQLRARTFRCWACWADILPDYSDYTPKCRDAEVLYSDGHWRPCMVVSWARCRAGWMALIRPCSDLS
jgi:hypothetical protein